MNGGSSVMETQSFGIARTAFRRLLLIAILPLSLRCVDSPEYVGFVTQAALPILDVASPKSRSIAVVEPGTQLAIGGIRDHFTRVRTPNGQTGYVADSESRARENLSVFRPTPVTAAGVVHTATVMRQKPMADSDIVLQLPIDTRLRIEGVSNLEESVGIERGRWLQVEIESPGENDQVEPSQRLRSIKGYVFSSRLFTGSQAEVRAYEAGSALSLNDGNALLLVLPRIFIFAESGKPSEVNRMRCFSRKGESVPRAGALVEVSAVRQANSAKFLGLSDMNCPAGKDQDGNVQFESAWIPASEAQLIADVFAYTRQFHPEIPEAIKDQINASLRGLDARDMEMWKLPSRDDGQRLLVRAWKGFCTYEGCHKGFYFERRDGAYTLVGQFENPVIQDLDGNGIVEVISEQGGRGGPFYSFYAWDGSKKEFAHVPMDSPGEARLRKLERRGSRIIVESETFIPGKNPAQPWLGSVLVVTSILRYQNGKVSFTPIGQETKPTDGSKR